MRTPVRELEPSQFFQGLYAVQNAQLGQSKAGKPYLKCLLSDSTGRLAARMWNVPDAVFAALPRNGFVFVEGQTQPYQGEVQAILQSIVAAQPSPAELGELVPHTKHDIDKMFAAIGLVVGSLENPAIKALATCYLEDHALMGKFKMAPAAVTLHHAYIGGLLEHTLSLLRLAHVVVPRYPGVNRDLVMMGLFLHDLGKCLELSWETGFEYTDDGHLIGHIARGCLLLEDKAQQCAAKGVRVPAPILRVLHHIVLSHHGQVEFGAVRVPATPEALLVSLLDNLDAKMAMALTATRDPSATSKAADGHFTEKIWALDTRLYRPDPTTLPDEDDAGPAR